MEIIRDNEINEYECSQCEKYKDKIRQLEELLFQQERKEIEISKIDEELKNNPIDFSEETIINKIKKYYTYDLFLKGREGLVCFVYSYIVQDNKLFLYRCADKTKKLFHYYDEEKGICIDNKCKILLRVLHPPFVKYLHTIYRKGIDELYKEQEIKLQKQTETNEHSINSNISDIEEFDEDEDGSDFDSDIDEILATELLEETIKDEFDDKINKVVSCFLEIKSCFKTNKKFFIDELTKVL